MITRATLSTIEQGLPKYRSMLAGNSAFSPGAFESIATVTLGTNASVINITSIPSSYKSLQIRVLGSITGGYLGYMYAQFNGAATNYYAHALTGDGTTAAATSFSPTELALGAVDGRSATSLTGIIADIHDYSSTTKNKTLRSISGADNNGSGSIYLWSGLWASTDAITSIRIFGNTYTSGTTFALYGIKG